MSAFVSSSVLSRSLLQAILHTAPTHVQKTLRPISQSSEKHIIVYANNYTFTFIWKELIVKCCVFFILEGTQAHASPFEWWRSNWFIAISMCVLFILITMIVVMLLLREGPVPYARKCFK